VSGRNRLARSLHSARRRARTGMNWG
jgi:hypothetical protein